MRLRLFLATVGGLTALRAIAACVGDDPVASSQRDRDGSVADGGEPGGGDTGPTFGPSPAEQYHQGTRLVPNVVTVGGAPYFLDWWDSTRKVHCAFQQLSNGDYRCLPTAPRATPFDYADPACSTQVAYISDSARVCTSAPALVNVANACDPELVTTGAVVTSTLYQKGPSCTPDPQGVTPLSFQLAPTAIAPSTWVSATLKEGQDETGTAFKAELLQGDDGSLGFYRWVPKTIETECTPGSPFADAAARCYPTARSSFTGYADSTCTTAAYLDSAGCGAAARVGVMATSSGDACSASVPAPRFDVLGARVDGGAIFVRGGDGRCVQNSGQADVVQSGGVIDAAGVFGEVSPVRVDAGAPLTATYWVTPSGVRSRAGWYDNDRKTACAFSTATDGRTRCLPVANAPVTFFADALCTTKTRVALVAPPSTMQCLANSFGKPCRPTACAVPPLPSFVVDDVLTGNCTTRREVYALGASRPVYVENAETRTCEHVDQSDVATYALTVVPPTAFVDGRATFDP